MKKYQITWEKAVEALSKFQTYRDLNITYSVQYLKRNIPHQEKSAIDIHLKLRKNSTGAFQLIDHFVKFVELRTKTTQDTFSLYCPADSLQRSAYLQTVNRDVTVILITCLIWINLNFYSVPMLKWCQNILLTFLNFIRTQTLMRKEQLLVYCIINLIFDAYNIYL